MRRLHFMPVAEKQQHQTCQNNALPWYPTTSYQTEQNKRQTEGGDPEPLLNLSMAKTGEKVLLITWQINHRLKAILAFFLIIIKTRATHPKNFCKLSIRWDRSGECEEKALAASKTAYLSKTLKYTGCDMKIGHHPCPQAAYMSGEGPRQQHL